MPTLASDDAGVEGHRQNAAEDMVYELATLWSASGTEDRRCRQWQAVGHAAEGSAAGNGRT